MLKLLKGLTVAYLVVCLLFFIFQRKLIYFPVQASGFAPEKAVEIQTENALLRGWALNTDSEDAVVYFGGNAEAVENNIALFDLLFPDRAVLLFAYRGYSGSEGAPSEQALYADALAIFDQADSRYNNVSLIGRSLGSGVATYVAAHREAEKLVLITPFDSITAMAQELYPWLPVRFLLLDRYDSLARVEQIAEPTLLLVASQDQVVPRVHSQRLEHAFRPAQVQAVLVEGANHNNIGQYSAYRAALAAFL